MTAQRIVELAQLQEMDHTKSSPFYDRACKTGFEYYSEKLDIITIVSYEMEFRSTSSRISVAFQSQQSEFAAGHVLIPHLLSAVEHLQWDGLHDFSSKGYCVAQSLEDMRSIQNTSERPYHDIAASISHLRHEK
ncbi:hypothetical protein CQW23_28392 [Capsicum baccatum]|uniref:Uncharacterized protein n=1 Tax=Capsicum baccatum TaxID=33114 RepID=A0A2G2VGD8_CAPBA|nr:hypothetical protein CQW23_28392 [Capsicum baccatum]